MRFDLKYMRMLTQTVPYNGSLKLKPYTGQELCSGCFNFIMFSFISICIILFHLSYLTIFSCLPFLRRIAAHAQTGNGFNHQIPPNLKCQNDITLII